MVIPAPIRAKAGLKPGSMLEVELDGSSIRLVRDVPRPKLVRVGNRLVIRPSVKREKLPPIDIPKLIEEERDRWPW